MIFIEKVFPEREGLLCSQVHVFPLSLFPRHAFPSQCKSLAFGRECLRNATLYEITSCRSEAMKADTDKAGFWAINFQAPRNSTGLVVKGNSAVPSASSRVLVTIRVGKQGSTAQLHGHPRLHCSRFEHPPEVPELQIFFGFFDLQVIEQTKLSWGYEGLVENLS